ncbi:MAG TPA: Rpn family recombination-promoting nuclease/putative transposase [Kofleriaceae bacterium]|nr:Rpn family recombination-promoting nuclease/putative transposase [Kofleriaceae bacterium]
MPAGPHDALFRWAFEAPAAAAGLVRGLVPRPIRDAIAWDTLAGASGAFVDLVHGARHNDLLFTAQLRVAAAAPAFLLLEHQSTADPAMPLRVLAYQTRIWARCRKAQPGSRLPPIVSVVVSHAPGGWTAASTFKQLLHPAVVTIPGLAALVPRCALIIDDLTGQSDAELRARALAPSQTLALWLLRDGRAPGRLLDRFDAWSPTILEAGRTRSGREALTVLVQYLFEVLEPRYFEAVRAKLQQLGTRSKEIAVTIADYLKEQGRAEGREQGRLEGRKQGRQEGRKQGRKQGRQEGHQEGRQEGRRATLRSQLLYKFQALDATAEARLAAATPAALDRYLRRVLTADSLAAVFAERTAATASRRRPRRSTRRPSR